MKNRIAFISLGCAKNLVDSERMMYRLEEAGFDVTGETDGADAVVVNTCGFIEAAVTESIDTVLELGKAKKEGRTGKIIVAGCMPERYRDDVMKELPEADAIVGPGSFNDIVAAVNNVLGGRRSVFLGDINAPEAEIPRVLTTPPAWAYIKIAEGCDNRCAYCVIPDLRGKFRSRSMDSVVSEAEALARRGVKELIVVAQDITRYGLDVSGKRCLAPLLEALCEIDGLKWIRLHYLYPDEIDDRLIDVIAKNDKILKYMDIPIQHINDGILKRMHRRGTGNDIRVLIGKLRARIPGLVLRTSLITGLPGEGEAEFEELCDFLREAKIERAGVFPFSPEEGTPAAAMAHVDRETAERRKELIMDLQSQIIDDFNEKRRGTRVSVLTEGFDGKYYYGRSYAESPDIDGRILFTGEGVKINDFTDVLITGSIDGEAVGKKV